MLEKESSDRKLILLLLRSLQGTERSKVRTTSDNRKTYHTASVDTVAVTQKY